MPKEVLTDAFVEINSVDLSDHVKEVTLNYEAELEDDTVMGDDTRSGIPGLLNWSLDLSWAQNFDAAKVDATLFPLVGDASGFVVKLRRKTDAIAADNPEFSGRGTIASYAPITGAVGSFHQAPVSIQPCKGTAGGHTLTRSTS